jgi:RNA 3'-terminal phosphate cyclase (ATP)
MIDIDGSEGGGQLLRSALAASALTGEAVHFEEIRGGRPEPGLRPQHLAVVELLADVCDAETSTAEIGTEELTFQPEEIRPGQYEVDIGTAGSVTLLFDAVLPLATALDGGLSVVARGGTDVKWSPTMAHYRRVKLPLVRQFGLQAVVEVDRSGFYPAGGGEATLRVGPSSLYPIRLEQRGEFTGARVYSLASQSLAEPAVAERQAEQAVDSLDDAGLDTVEREVRYVAAESPGSALLVRLDYEDTRAGFDALGEPGKPSETVATEATERATDFHAGDGALDAHTADQMLAFLALADGRIRIPEVTDHVQTNRDLLAAFGFDVSIQEERVGVIVD